MLIVLSLSLSGQQPYIDSLKRLLDKSPDTKTQLSIYYKIAKSYRNLNPYIGLDYIDSARHIAIKSGDKQMEARIINETGVLYRKVDLYREAVDQHQKALKIFRQARDSMGIAFAYANLGNVFLIIGQLDKALEYNLRSLQMKYELRDSLQIAYSLRTTALVYQAMKKYDSAMRYFSKALDIYQVKGDKYDVGNIYYHLATANLASGTNQNLALLYLGKAFDFYDELESDYGTALVKYNAGKAYYQLKKFDKARELYSEALQLAQKSGTPKILLDVYRDLSELNKKLGNYRESLIYFENYARIRDSLFNETFSKNIVEMQAKYKNDEQLAEIALLKKENQLIRNEQRLKSAYVYLLVTGILLVLAVLGLLMWRYRDKKRINKQLEEEVKNRKDHEQKLIQSERQLKEVNLTKDKFFSIISHDLKSPFGAMKGLVELLQAGYDEMSDMEKKELIGEINKATNNTFSLLSNLLAWSQSQRDTIEFHPVAINVSEICSGTIDFLLPAARKKNIGIESNIAEDLHVVADRNMLTTIIRNLLSNAVKFTSDGGTVNIKSKMLATQHGNNGYNKFVEISVSDTGVGISGENLDKIFRIEEKFKTPGTNDESGTGLGLMICKEFVEKHHGTIRVDSEEGVGSTFAFTLPAANNTGVLANR